MQQKVDKICTQAAKKSAKYRADPVSSMNNATAMDNGDDDADDGPQTLQTFSKSQHWHLAKLQLSLLKAESDVSAAKSAQQLA